MVLLNDSNRKDITMRVIDLANSLLINFARTAVYLRNDITNSVNIQIADIFIEAFDHNITNNEMCEKIKDLKIPWAEGLIYDSSNEAFGDEDEKSADFFIRL